MESASRGAGSNGGSRVRLATIAIFVLVEAVICVLRALAVRPQMSDPARVPYLFLWGFAGTVAVAAILTLRRDASWRLPIAFIAPDVLLFALQRAMNSVDGQFYALNFVTPWQVGAIAAWAGGIFTRAPIPSPGPSWLGKPTWRWGLFLVYFSLLLQATPKPRLLEPLLESLAFLMFGGLLLGLVLFFIGGAFRLARRR
jgi:hypothetical protein